MTDATTPITGSEHGFADYVPRVSIGVPAYNCERFLALTLESLVQQTFTDIEIIICDNASCDATPDIAREYQERDARIRYVRNSENLGAARNFVRCVELARGELFRWSSSDDLSAPTFVERCVEVLDAHPDVVQAYPRAMLIDENGNELEKYDETIEALADSARDRYLHVMHHVGLINAWYGVMRTDMLRRTRVLGPYLGADTIVQAEIALYGKIREVPEYLFFRRMHQDALSSMTPEEMRHFYNPAKSTGIVFTRWRQLGERLLSVARSPLRASEKTLLSAAIVRIEIGSREHYAAELATGIRARWNRGRGA